MAEARAGVADRAAPHVVPDRGARPVTGSSWRLWLRAVRPFSFTAAIVPIVAASALAFAAGRFDPLLGALMLVASVACQAGANLANDYHDHLRGLDTARSLGPSGVIQANLLSAAAVRRGMLVCFALATALGLVVVARTGWVVLVLALASLGAAYLYTGGPKPLAYVALGEVVVFLSMGLGMVVGAFYVYAGAVSGTVMLAALPIAALVAAILHANNMRDVETDRAAGKVTLAALLGPRRAFAELALLIVVAYLAVPLLVAANPRLWPALVALVTMPRALALLRLARPPADPDQLNRAVRRSAGLHLAFGLWFAAGLACAALLQR